MSIFASTNVLKRIKIEHCAPEYNREHRDVQSILRAGGWMILSVDCPVPGKEIREVFVTLFVFRDPGENVLKS